MTNERAYAEIYAIWDNVADEIHGPLQMYKHAAVAIRAFKEVAADTRTQLSKNPADYDLVQLGIITQDGDLVASGKVRILPGTALLEPTKGE